MIYEKFPVVFLSMLSSEKADSTNSIIAEYILAHRSEMDEMGIKDLAQACHVGTGSVSRFVREIGLNDFSELKTIMKEAVFHFEKTEGRDWSETVTESIKQAAVTTDMKQIEKLCSDLRNYESIYACGMLKAESAALNMQVDMLMLGKRVRTSVAYKDQIETILNAGKEDLIIIYSYTGSFFEYQDFRIREKRLQLPKIWMITGSKKEMPWFVNEVISFDSDLSQLTHPYQLETIESLIVQTYAVTK